VVHEREIGSAKGDKPEKADRPEKAAPKPVQKKTSGATDGTAAAKATLPPTKSGGNGRATNGRKPAAGKATNGNAASDDAAAAPKPHPRSRSKRNRKAR